MPLPSKRLCVGVVAGPHGIRGGVRIKSFTAVPEDVGAYGPVSDEAGARTYGIRVNGQVKGVVLARLDGVSTREAAEALKGLELYVDRDRLPPVDEEEFYHADLVGLGAELEDGTPLGEVVAVWGVGAGDSIEIALTNGQTTVVPFTRAAVPVVDLQAGRVVIVPPEGLFDKPEPPASVEEQAMAAAEVLGSDGSDESEIAPPHPTLSTASGGEGSLGSLSALQGGEGWGEVGIEAPQASGSVP